MKTYVSFLGTGAYVPCVYLKPDETTSDSGVVTYVQTAMRKLVARDAEKTLVFCTKAATEKHWQQLCEEFARQGLAEPERVAISDGSNMKEFWEIFETVNAHIPERAQIVFDVTHSFRSLPLIMSVLLNYLEVVKGTRLVGCYYGAFESLGRAKDVEKNYPDPTDRRAPIFDLTQFFLLNEWVRAIRAFERFGDAGDLNELAKQVIQPLLAKEETRTTEIVELRKLTGALDNFTQQVRSSRCNDIQTFEFKKHILNRLDAARACNVLPQLTPVLDKLDGVFAKYQDKDLKNGMHAARWAFDHDLIPQGYTLLQETVVSHFTQKFDTDLKQLYPEDEIKRRDYMSSVLAWRNKDPWEKDDSERAARLKKEIKQEVQPQYDILTQGRNDVNHGGLGHNAKTAKKLKDDLGKAIEKFHALLSDTSL